MDLKPGAAGSRCQILNLQYALKDRKDCSHKDKKERQRKRKRELRVGWDRTLNKVPEAGMGVTCAEESLASLPGAQRLMAMPEQGQGQTLEEGLKVKLFYVG